VTSRQTSHKDLVFPVLLRIVTSLLAIVVCLFLFFLSAQMGFSRLLGRYGILTNSIPATAEAVRLTPSDADAHRARATVFRNLRMYQDARQELETAISLRPNDDYLWLELGSVRDELGDSEGALRALDQAVAHAPYYAHTRWQRANLRLRMGRYDEAFAELREAAESNQSLLPNLIDLAWSLSRGEAKVTEQLAGIESAESRVAFARFLARQGRGKETLEQFRLTANYISRDYKRELVRELMAAHEYQEAFEIWQGSDTSSSNKDSQIFDGGFEGTISFDDVGFGWNVSREQSKVSVSQDPSDKDTGEKSIRIVFEGDSPSAKAIISQTILVKPQHKYRINFAVKAKDIVSGALPLLTVVDASGDVVLSRLDLPQRSGSWQKERIEFTSLATSAAIVLKLIRHECPSSPCPIFGSLGLDSFSIEELDSFSIEEIEQ
jgi:tetratricopeptide (TPR) repeat protein